MHSQFNSSITLDMMEEIDSSDDEAVSAFIRSGGSFTFAPRTHDVPKSIKSPSQSLMNPSTYHDTNCGASLDGFNFTDETGGKVSGGDDTNSDGCNNREAFLHLNGPTTRPKLIAQKMTLAKFPSRKNFISKQEQINCSDEFRKNNADQIPPLVLDVFKREVEPLSGDVVRPIKFIKIDQLNSVSPAFGSDRKNISNRRELEVSGEFKTTFDLFITPRLLSKDLGWTTSSDEKYFCLQLDDCKLKVSRNRLLQILNANIDQNIFDGNDMSDPLITGRIEDCILQSIIHREVLVKNSINTSLKTSMDDIDENKSSTTKKRKIQLGSEGSKNELKKQRKSKEQIAKFVLAEKSYPRYIKRTKKYILDNNLIHQIRDKVFRQKNMEELSDEERNSLLQVKVMRSTIRASVRVYMKGRVDLVDDCKTLCDKQVSQEIARYNLTKLSREQLEMDIRVDSTQNLGAEFVRGGDDIPGIFIKDFKPNGQLEQIFGKQMTSGLAIVKMRQHGQKEEKHIKKLKDKNTVMNQAKAAYRKSMREEDKWVIVNFRLERTSDLSGININSVFLRNPKMKGIRFVDGGNPTDYSDLNERIRKIQNFAPRESVKKSSKVYESSKSPLQCNEFQLESKKSVSSPRDITRTNVKDYRRLTEISADEGIKISFIPSKETLGIYCETQSDQVFIKSIDRRSKKVAGLNAGSYISHFEMVGPNSKRVALKHHSQLRRTYEEAMKTQNANTQLCLWIHSLSNSEDRNCQNDWDETGAWIGKDIAAGWPGGAVNASISGHLPEHGIHPKKGSRIVPPEVKQQALAQKSFTSTSSSFSLKSFVDNQASRSKQKSSVSIKPSAPRSKTENKNGSTPSALLMFRRPNQSESKTKAARHSSLSRSLGTSKIATSFHSISTPVFGASRQSLDEDLFAPDTVTAARNRGKTSDVVSTMDRSDLMLDEDLFPPDTVAAASNRSTASDEVSTMDRSDLMLDEDLFAPDTVTAASNHSKASDEVSTMDRSDLMLDEDLFAPDTVAAASNRSTASDVVSPMDRSNNLFYGNCSFKDGESTRHQTLRRKKHVSFGEITIHEVPCADEIQEQADSSIDIDSLYSEVVGELSETQKQVDSNIDIDALYAKGIEELSLSALVFAFNLDQTRELSTYSSKIKSRKESALNEKNHASDLRRRHEMDEIWKTYLVFDTLLKAYSKTQSTLKRYSKIVKDATTSSCLMYIDLSKKDIRERLNTIIDWFRMTKKSAHERMMLEDESILRADIAFDGVNLLHLAVYVHDIRLIMSLLNLNLGFEIDASHGSWKSPKQFADDMYSFSKETGELMHEFQRVVEECNKLGY